LKSKIKIVSFIKKVLTPTYIRIWKRIGKIRKNNSFLNTIKNYESNSIKITMSVEEESAKISKENLDKVIEFIPYFEDKANVFYILVPPREVKQGVYHVPYYDYSKKVSNFLDSLYKENFTTYYGEAKDRYDIFRFINRRIPLSEASIQDIRAIFKTILAGERLTMGGGYIASSIDNGLVLDLLKRLKEIKEAMD